MKIKTSRKILSAMFLSAALLLTGCGESDVEVTSEQNDLIAEYVAGVLMKHSYENKWKYVKLDANITNYQRPSQAYTQAAPKPSSQAQQGGTQPKSADAGTTSSGTLSDLASALELSGVTITYAGNTVCQNYPEGSDVLSVMATSGRDILAVEFDLKNTTENDVICNTAPLGVVMRITVNNTTTVTEYATMLNNDLNTLSGVSIAPGQSYRAVVLFMVPKGSADNISSLVITLSGQGVTAARIVLE